MKKISIITPTFNEEANIPEIHKAIKEIMTKECSGYDYEHIFIDNCSLDSSEKLLREIAKNDSKVKLILNNRNFGPVRSPYYGLLSATGDAAILIAADFQEPPTLIPEFIKRWTSGYKVVLGVKTKNENNTIFFKIRKLYYKVLNKLSNVRLIENTTAFGIIDKSVLEELKKLNESYPYLRGLLSDLGYRIDTVEYIQPERIRGISAANWYTLYDWAWLGITSHSKIPLRMATILGFILSLLSLFISIGYLLLKLIFWDSFPFGLAPALIGLFFFSSVQLLFIGVLGEYVGSIYTKIENKPLVIEKERINF